MNKNVLMSIIAGLILLFSSTQLFSQEPECGDQAEGKFCPNGLCCSDWGYCGTGEEFCNSSKDSISYYCWKEFDGSVFCPRQCPSCIILPFAIGLGDRGSCKVKK
jgi:hypothetical protein